MCEHAYEVDVGNFSLPTSQYTMHEKRTAVTYRMCAHAYAVDVGNFSLPTSQYAINDILGLKQTTIT